MVNNYGPMVSLASRVVGSLPNGHFMAYKFGYWDDPKNCGIRSTQERLLVDYEQGYKKSRINHEAQVTEQQSFGLAGFR